jgi:hypothetical protein
MNPEDYFYNISLPIDFIDILYKELETTTWYTSPTKLCRSDIVGETRNLIEKAMPFKVHCCGFFKNDPRFKYPIHRDFQRLAAVNIQLGESFDDYQVVFYNDDLSQLLNIPYQTDKPLLINTKKLHSVFNKSNDKTRYVLSVGCIDESYEVIKNKFK